MPPSSAVPPVRVVLDTNAWLDLLWFRDARCARLGAALAEGHLSAVTNTACRDEWLRVLGYAPLGIDAAERAALAQRYDACSELVDAAPGPVALPRCADPDDQKFLALAYAAGAAILVTRDAALLALHRRCHRAGLFAILQPEAIGAQLDRG